MLDHVSTSSSLTHREYVDRWLALAVAATTFVGYVSSVYWERTWGPRLLLRREIALENEIDRLEREADAVCTTSKLYEHSRLMRGAVLLRRELLQERRRRYRYEVSVESVFSPLSTVHSVRRGFNARELARTPTLCPSAASHSATQSPATSRGNEGAASSQVCLATEYVCRLIRYNLLSVVKYVLRFGHVFVYLHLFGRRPGLIVIPPSIENSAHFYLTDVVIPYIFGLAFFGPAIFFAPRHTLTDNVSEGNMFTNISLARLGSELYGPPSAANESTGDLKDAAATVLFVRRYNAVRLCASNDLLWWFFCCFCASYLLMRTFASYKMLKE